MLLGLLLCKPRLSSKIYKPLRFLSRSSSAAASRAFFSATLCGEQASPAMLHLSPATGTCAGTQAPPT